ncbi:helix-turn-helix transcriptional regulator [Mycobacterium sp. IDR2000157661]|uniref:helix-turn-helix transcriptional regulator n=1 Tax=Mycobacterium sp. IDR2000157661 TaxID=2867005 RepID=UPI001EE9FA51|nr:helix-turn-helix transcriptional regulator [Mycobacterium sp. IDR2000157661]ULE32013.1 LuxR C-terminal-related transcriptional regulator [Mycobacterium sp. IDR2000157661]
MITTRIDPHTELLLAARNAHVRRDWHASYEAFARAGEDTALNLDDLDAMAVAAWRLGHGKESLRVAERVFTQLARTDPPSAAMKAVDVALAWLTRGDMNIGQAWMNRARRLLDGAPEGTAHGYLAYLDAAVAVMNRDTGELNQRVGDLREMCGRLDSPALTALCHVAQGLEALLAGRLTEAYGLIDEAMLPVLADQVPLEWAGDIYCTVLHHCHRLADLPRMRAWTQSMERWCAQFAGSVTYGGVCDVHRLQVQAATDDLRLLEERLDTASRTLEGVNTWAAGEGYYQLGEVRRRRGDVEGAFAAYTRARTLGIEPQPGEALLRCRTGDSDTAWTDLRVALAGLDRLDRMWLLRGAVEVALARGDVDEAEAHCRELESGAEAFATPGFRAWAAHARGAVLVHRGRHEEAVGCLETALREYRTQQSRYDTAQVYEWLAQAHRGLGDQQTAAADVATAENIYGQLGVEPVEPCGATAAGGLTKREIDVLRRIAGGATNKQVAEQMCLSEKTVGRHLANVYAKLGVSSRTAALAWAHDNNLLQ